MALKHIIFTFETQIPVSVSPKQFHELQISQDLKILQLVCGAIQESKYCNNVLFVLDRVANENVQEDKTLFDHILNVRDIESIQLQYEDECVDAYFVPWNSAEETINSYQHSEILDDGSLLVNIAENVDEEELKYIRMLHKTNFQSS